MPTEDTWTTKPVSEAFGVHPNTVRQWIKSKDLPEPGWGKRGRRRERRYGRTWIKEAATLLDITVDWDVLENAL